MVTQRDWSQLSNVTQPGSNPGLQIWDLVLFSWHPNQHLSSPRSRPWGRNSRAMSVFETLRDQCGAVCMWRGGGGGGRTENTQSRKKQPGRSIQWARYCSGQQKHNPLRNTIKHKPHNYPSQGVRELEYLCSNYQESLKPAPRRVNSLALPHCSSSEK
jgi:hypothetical protein